MSRAALRVCALLIMDCAAFLLLRTVLRGLRTVAGGGAQGQFIHWLFADGYLGGWQYAAALLLALITRGTYGPGDGRRDPGRILLACALATALPLWASLWTQPLLLTAGQYVLTVPPAFIVIFAFRLVLDQLIVRFAPHPSAGALSRAILVGHAGECIDMRGRRALTERGGIEVLGFVDVKPQAARGALGSLDALEALLLEHRADTIILCGPVDDYAVLAVMRAARATECQVLTAARRFELAGIVPSIVWRRGQPFIMLRRVGLRWQQLVLKRILDVTLSAAALIVLSPLMAIIAMAVWLESGGPVLFKQMRPGRGGRRFGMLKFRSMHTNAEALLRADPELHAIFLRNSCKLPEHLDPRITRVGRFLRHTSLDELPQLWNVLKGDMSLVGPRPVVGPELESYGEGTHTLLSVRPGITGMWQVNGRSNVQFPERAYMELEYVERWSLLLDLWILLQTIPAVLMRHGAY